jgi:penicillin amidase
VRERLEKIKFNPLSVERTIELEIIEHLISFDATNCWAVSGNYTESGLPLLSNDPHLENIMPSQWYGLRVNLTTPEGKNYRFVGGMNPGNHQLYGKHSYLATGMSISHGDNQDLYRETVEGNKYLLNGEWRDLKVRN